jgi:DNA-binding SARP family transcriptional activator
VHSVNRTRTGECHFVNRLGASGGGHVRAYIKSAAAPRRPANPASGDAGACCRILGPVEVVGADGPVALGGPRQVALLACLLLHRNRVVSVEDLTDAVWDGAAGPGAAKRVRVAVARLRRSLAPVAGRLRVETLRGGYRLRVAPDEVDADRFAAAVAGGRAAIAAGDLPRAAATLDAALALWSGPALADVAGQRFAHTPAAMLDDLRVWALELRIDVGLGLGRHRELLGELRGLAAAHPDRESIVAALMVALYRSGRHTEALEVFHHTRSHLCDELGLEPGPGLRALQQSILAHDDRLAVPMTPPDQSPGKPDGSVAPAAGRP